MTTEEFELHQLTAKGKELLSRSRKCLESAQNEETRSLAKEVPAKIVDRDKENVNLVFIGQYSAGKSSIMKVLTGQENIAIGAGITTEQTHTYNWGGITVVDTPGIHTELRPDHDEITYEAIAGADLLIFVITNELFDSHIADHFRKLAIDHDRAREMMLVVNKMSRSSKGNSPEVQNVIREDLRKVLAPFTPEDLRVTFIDAEDALESKTETDAEFAKLLWQRSGFDKFTKELNKFVREKGLFSRYTTALYTLESILQKALCSESEDNDEAVEGLEEAFLRRRKALYDTKIDVKRGVEGEIQNKSSEVRQEGRRIADMINGSADEKAVKQELQAAEVHVKNIAEQLQKSILEIISKYTENLDNSIVELAKSDFAKYLYKILASRIQSVSPDTTKKIQKAADFSAKLGNCLVKNSISPKNGIFSWFEFTQYYGTPTESAIKAIGNLCGKSLWPWESIALTRTVANCGKVLSGVGIVVSIGLQWREDSNEEQLETKLRENRAAVRDIFNKAANEIEMRFNEATQSYVSKIEEDIEETDSNLDNLRNLQKNKSDLFKKLTELLEETNELIKKIHAIGIE